MSILQYSEQQILLQFSWGPAVRLLLAVKYTAALLVDLSAALACCGTVWYYNCKFILDKLFKKNETTFLFI